MNNKTAKQPQSQGKIIIEVQPKEGINLNTGKPYDGSISIQIKAMLSENDRVMVLHALAVSLSKGNNTEALKLLHTASKLALHTCLTGNSWCDVIKRKEKINDDNDLCVLGYLGSNNRSLNMDNNIRMGSILHGQTLCGITLHHKAQKGIEVIPLCTPVLWSRAHTF